MQIQSSKRNCTNPSKFQIDTTIHVPPSGHSSTATATAGLLCEVSPHRFHELLVGQTIGQSIQPTLGADCGGVEQTKVEVCLTRVAQIPHLCFMFEAKCKMQNAKCEMQNAKCKMQNAKCKMQNAKCEMPIPMPIQRTCH